MSPKFPECFGSTTRVLSVADLAHKVEGENPWPGQGAHFFSQVKLLLTQDGSWVLWSAKYERVVTDGHGYSGQHTGVNETALLSEFIFLEEAQFLATFERYPKGPAIILRSLYQVLLDTVHKMQSRVDTLHQVGLELEGIVGRAGV